MSKLVYIGNGRWIVGIPARNLSADEVAQHGEDFLLETGLYKKPAPPKRKRSKKKPAGAGASEVKENE
jgi:hypothetical protein